MDGILEPVLRELARDARLTAAQIAANLGEDEAAVTEAMREGEERNIVLGHGAKINWETLGLSTVYAVVEVTVEPQENVGYNAVARRIARFDEVQTVYFVSGAYDLLVMIAADNMRGISDFVGERLATMSGVKGTTTRVLMRRYKEDGVYIDSDLQNDRQKVVF
ncbi:MAG: Lrp/AsnC family transcriptional regulator [Chloroflexi bacterium]|nr:Lrp/AsnC family transcriptional regulator [Chloroflexota bacterium]MCY3696212.1 Lrp/AsnC family transcriptional regulator [Chloroflexota bacterium]MXX31179.1 Lrp/AsnC family transcriptional regulator [Chloroflexota bacterium]MXX79894.1 Lrp/AsnC family transcriptional regulator [Chloroflexota bacterium]MYD16766.1 Lrp/AsnC family transcriptional regulator [Chloroflexota bacterium]